MNRPRKLPHGLLISTLAEYQTDFWLRVGLECQHRGVDCEFLSFDDRSTEALRQAGFRVYASSEQPAVSDELALLDEFESGPFESLFLHERVAFNEQNHSHLRTKLCRSIRLADMAIASSLERFEAVEIGRASCRERVCPYG